VADGVAEHQIAESLQDWSFEAERWNLENGRQFRFDTDDACANGVALRLY
jgi:squalene cyclase